MNKKGLLDKISRFFSPGYMITISVSDVDNTVLDKITDTLKAKGFILVGENPHPVRRGYLLASYLKSFSSERNDCIFATCHYPKTAYPEKRLESLWLIMQNEVRGRETAINSKMDEIGDSLLDEVSKY
ncbi:MAG TPA: hypothetical protein VN328_13560, partial [Thermodesulfovibrionales bacterium]|nr:hypothetical protein [Thermodesulfovibrionales bacterium]